MLHWNTKWNKRELDWWPKFASFCHQVSPPAKQLWQVAPSLLFFNFSFQSSSISQNIIQMFQVKSEYSTFSGHSKRKVKIKAILKMELLRCWNGHFSDLLILLVKPWFFIINLSTNDPSDNYKRNPRSLDTVVTILVFPSHPGIWNFILQIVNPPNTQQLSSKLSPSNGTWA